MYADGAHQWRQANNRDGQKGPMWQKTGWKGTDMTTTEIRHRQRLRQRRLKRKYGPDELAEMDLDERTPEEVEADLGDAECHRQRED